MVSLFLIVFTLLLLLLPASFSWASISISGGWIVVNLLNSFCLLALSMVFIPWVHMNCWHSCAVVLTALAPWLCLLLATFSSWVSLGLLILVLLFLYVWLIMFFGWLLSLFQFGFTSLDLKWLEWLQFTHHDQIPNFCFSLEAVAGHAAPWFALWYIILVSPLMYFEVC